MQIIATWFQAGVSPLSVWQGVLIVVVTWLVTGGVVYGIIKTTVSSHGDRIEALEDDVKNRMVTRREFDDKHKDNVERFGGLQRGMGRIETKVDALFERRARSRD